MARSAPPLSLAAKVEGAADAVRTIRAKIHAYETTDLPAALDVLANLESQVSGKAPGWEDATLSGLIPPGTNPYDPKPPEPVSTPPKKEAPDGGTPPPVPAVGSKTPPKTRT